MLIAQTNKRRYLNILILDSFQYYYYYKDSVLLYSIAQ